MPSDDMTDVMDVISMDSGKEKLRLNVSEELAEWASTNSSFSPINFTFTSPSTKSCISNKICEIIHGINIQNQRS